MIFLKNLARTLATFAIFLFPTGCFFKKTVWVYTSLPKEMISEMSQALVSGVPDAEVKWVQGTSEAIEAKLKAEEKLGHVKADLVLISDPVWYLDQKKTGNLLPYRSEMTSQIAPNYRDPDDAFVTVRISLMLLGYNSKIIEREDLPLKWSELAQSKWNGKISMGNPLEFSTHFLALANLSKRFGWSFFSNLRKINVLAEGGNVAVTQRVVNGERPVGIVLMENVLRAQILGNPVQMIYPEEGAIPIPAPIAILKSTKNPKIVKKVYDWFFSIPAQNLIVRGGMYSPLPGVVRPERVYSVNEFPTQISRWSPELLNEIYRTKDQVRAKFSEVVFH